MLCVIPKERGLLKRKATKCPTHNLSISFYAYFRSIYITVWIYYRRPNLRDEQVTYACMYDGQKEEMQPLMALKIRIFFFIFFSPPYEVLINGKYCVTYLMRKNGLWIIIIIIILNLYGGGIIIGEDKKFWMEMEFVNQWEIVFLGRWSLNILDRSCLITFFFLYLLLYLYQGIIKLNAICYEMIFFSSLKHETYVWAISCSKYIFMPLWILCAKIISVLIGKKFAVSRDKAIGVHGLPILFPYFFLITS